MTFKVPSYPNHSLIQFCDWHTQTIMLSEQCSGYSDNVFQYVTHIGDSTSIPHSGQDLMCYTLDEYNIEILCIKIIWFILLLLK